MMVSSLHQYLGTAGKVCNRFLLARDKDPHLLYVSCRAKKRSADDRCSNCHDWDDNIWQKVSDKLAAQRERKTKASFSSSSFFEFPPSMPIPLCDLSCLFDNAVVLAYVTCPSDKPNT